MDFLLEWALPMNRLRYFLYRLYRRCTRHITIRVNLVHISNGKNHMMVKFLKTEENYDEQ